MRIFRIVKAGEILEFSRSLGHGAQFGDCP